MPTVIDKLVVELGLDPKNFTAQQRQVLQDFKRTQDAARRGAQDVEKSGEAVANAFSRFRNEAIGLFAGLAGARGVKEFVSNLVTSDAAIGRFARTTAIAVEDAAKFSKAIELAGGSAEAGKAAMAALNEQVQAFRSGVPGEILAIYQQLTALGGKVIDLNKPIIEQLRAIAENARVIEAKTPGRGSYFLRQLGLNDDTINVLIRGGTYLDQMVDKADKLGAAIKKDADASEDLLSKWRTLSQLIQGLARPLIANVVAPTMDSINETLKEAKKNQDELYSRGAGAGQERFNGWMNYLLKQLGLASTATPAGLAAKTPLDVADVATAVYGRPGEARPGLVRGGVFGGLSYKPIDWPDAANPAIAASRGGVGPTSTSTSTINVNGPITIQTQATDAEGIARDLRAKLLAEGQRRASLANFGQE